MEKKQMRWWIAEFVLLMAAFVSLGWFGWNWAATEIDQRWSSYELNASLEGREPSLRGYIEEQIRGRKEEPPPPPHPSVGKPKPLPHVRTGETIGRVEIPRLRISAIVRQGVDDKVLRRAVGHVPQTALPGQTGNVGLAAHRDTHFRNLKGVKKGDRILMTTPEGTYEYRVETLQVVDPTDVEVLAPTTRPALTLVTCYPFNYVGSAPKRFIVHAKQVVEQASGAEQGKFVKSAMR